MKRSLIFIMSLCLAVVLITAGCNGTKVRVGHTLPAWSEGYLDIHTISTGRGECVLVIMPDGTSLVVDAGEFSQEGTKYNNVKQRPNADIRPTTVFSDYISHFIPQSDTIDYFNLSHYHMDHMGNMEPEYGKAVEGDYILSGVTALYHNLPFREIIDRAYPDFDSLAVNSMSFLALENYKKFLSYNIENRGLKASRFELGAVNQFAMRYNASAYPDFKIENICSNGYVWQDGKAFDVYQGDQRRENGASCGFVIRYGAFDFLTAGDIGDYYDLEYYVGKAAGDLDAVKAHHHLSPHSMCQKAMEVMTPEVMVVPSFYVREIQPDKSKFDYILQGGCKIFCTNVGEDLLEQYPDEYAKCSATNGHVVIRVEPNGKQYWVYTLDDTDELYRVKQIDGPFLCD